MSSTVEDVLNQTDSEQIRYFFEAMKRDYDAMVELDIKADRRNPFQNHLSSCLQGTALHNNEDNTMLGSQEEVVEYCDGLTEILHDPEIGDEFYYYKKNIPQELKDAGMDVEGFMIGIYNATAQNSHVASWTVNGKEITFNITPGLAVHNAHLLTKHNIIPLNEGVFNPIPLPLTDEAKAYLEAAEAANGAICWNNTVPNGHYYNCSATGEIKTFLEKNAGEEVSSLSDASTGTLTPPPANKNEVEPKVKAAGLGGN